MATKKKKPVGKKKATAPVKKSARKSAAPKKKAASPARKKSAVKKKAATSARSVKKAVASKKPLGKKNKTTAPATKKPVATKSKTKNNQNQRATRATVKDISRPTPEQMAALPPVEEKSPEIVPASQNAIPAVDKRTMHKAAVRNYDNHRLRLSNLSKAGIKPTLKKAIR